MDMNQETKVTVIDDRLRQEEAETLCRWAAARAGVIVVAPLLGTMALIANDVYLVIKLGSVYEEEIGEKAAVSLLSSLGAYFVGSTLTTLIPFAPLQIPVAVGTTYALGRVVTEWLKAGKPADRLKLCMMMLCVKQRKILSFLKMTLKKMNHWVMKVKNTICDQTIMNGGPLCTRTMM